MHFIDTNQIMSHFIYHRYHDLSFCFVVEDDVLTHFPTSSLPHHRYDHRLEGDTERGNLTKNKEAYSFHEM